MMTGLNRLTGVPWHIEKWHLDEGDSRRHCHRCIYYRRGDKFCSKIGRKCFGSAHCEHYSETAVNETKRFNSTLISLVEKPVTAVRKEEPVKKAPSVITDNNNKNGYSNFSFIGALDPELEKLGRDAEYYLGSDANVAIYKIGYLGEQIVNGIFEREKIEYLKSERQVDSINALHQNNFLPVQVMRALTDIRISRNKAVHENYDSEENARRLLKESFKICCWYMKEYGSRSFEPSQLQYIEPFYENAKFEKARNYVLPEKVIEDIKTEAVSDIKKTESPQTRQAEQEEEAEKIGIEMPAFSLDNGIVIEANCVPFMDRMNHVGIEELYIENNTDQLLENYWLEIESIPGFCLAYSKNIAQISPHRGLAIRNIDITVDEEKLMNVGSETFCYLTIILKKGNEVIAEERADLDIADDVRGKIEEAGAGPASVSFEYNENELNINPVLQEESRIYIPCGLGNSDNGFFIYGLTKSRLCTHQYADIYALVYNYMIRESRMDPNKLPVYLQKLDLPYTLDYRPVFRLSIVLLQMIKNNYAGSTLAVRYVGNGDVLKYASDLITDYACRFARLLKIRFTPVKIISSATGDQISVEHRAGIYTANNTELHTCAREMWFGRKLRYHLTENDKEDLLYILGEISNFDCFREGQFEALSSMISTDKNAVSIMPTGSGKSLIFYFASLLQPLPVMIVEPTDILITDQIRNLKKIHNIDNAAHLMVTDSFDFSGYELHNSLNYLTPETLTNRNLFSSFIHKFNIGENLKSEKIAPGPMMAYFILDEIHCISNWGHDFRPEYLMISKNLGRYLDHVQIWGFTGTANFTVVEDIQKQLSVPTENFFSPIQFEKYNVSYDFRECPSKKALYQEVAAVLDECRARNERTIIFTKNDKITELVTKAVDYAAMPFSHNDLNAYTQFSEGYIDSLISSEELGIGINFPNIRNVIHFGLPLSKNEYVQEIGRAGRSNERVRSYVLYLSDNRKNAPDGLISRELDINYLPDLIKHIDNDYSDIFHKLTGNISRKEELLKELLDLKNELNSSFRSAMLISAGSYEQITSLKRNLYMLYVCGFVEDWYTYGTDTETGQIQIYVKIPDERSEKKLKAAMQTKFRNYLSSLGTDNQREMVKSSLAKTTDDIISIYVDWYYGKYLYRNNEEFIDMFDFIKGSSRLTADDITDQIKDYFALPFTVMLDEETEYNSMDLRQIAEKSVVGFSRTTLANVERINSSKYSYKLDFMLLCGELRANGKLNTSRLERVLHSIPSGERAILDGIFERIYPACNTEGKLSVLNYLEVSGKRHHIALDDFIERVYRDNEFDDIYYAMIARRLNKLFAVRRL